MCVTFRPADSAKAGTFAPPLNSAVEAVEKVNLE